MRLIALVGRLMALLLTVCFTARDALGPTHITGAWTTETGNQDRNPGEWLETVKWLDADRKMFTRLMAALPTKKVSSRKYNLFEREHPTRWVTISGSHNNSTTTINVSDATPFRTDDVFVTPATGERFLVSAIASATSLTVATRPFQGTATALSGGEDAYILYGRAGENTLSAGFMTTDYTTQFNYAQIIKRSWGFSRSELKEMKRGPKEWAEQRRLADDLITEDLEHALLWGKKSLNISGGITYRTTGGIDEFIVTNRVDLEGGIGYGDIGWLVNQSTRHAPGKKVWLVSRDFRQQVDAAGYPSVQLSQDENVLGMAVDKFRSSNGEFILVTHHGLERGYGDRGFIVDTSHMSLAEFDPIHVEENIQENDRDGVKHQTIGEVGAWMDTEKAHMTFSGATPT